TLFLRYDRNPNGQITGIAYDVDFTSTSAERLTQIQYEDPDQMYPTRFVNQLGHTTRLAFHPGLGVQAAGSDPNEVFSRWQYDTFGRVKRNEPGGNEASSLSYHGYRELSDSPNKLSLELKQVGDSGWAIRSRFDALGRQVSEAVLTRADGS